MQLELPHLPKPIGFVFERQHSCIDEQSCSPYSNDGRVYWWRGHFSPQRPTGDDVRNVRPVFDRPSL